MNKVGCAGIVAFGALALVACGDDATPGIASGGRIKVQYYEFDDGTRQATRPLHDSARGESCDATVWADGVTRCTPASQDAGVPNARYFDASCTDDHRGFELYESAPYYVGEVDAAGKLDHLFRLDPISVGTYWYRDELGCQGPVDARVMVGIPGVEVDRAELATLDERAPEATGDRIARAAMVTDDGLYLPTDVVDTANDFPCSLAPSADGRRACLPSSDVQVGYRDAACMEPVVEVPTGWEVPRFAGDRRGCAPRLFELGAEQSTGPAFERDGRGGCVAAAPRENRRWFAATAREPAWFEHGPGAPTGDRLSLYVATNGDVHVETGALFDRGEQHACYPIEVPEGGYRCLPTGGAAIFDQFRDDACTQPVRVAAAWPAFSRCDEAPVAYAVPWLDAPRAIYRVGAPFAGSVWRLDGGICVPGVPAFLPADPELYEVGAVVPYTAFVGASLVPER